jgi:hypothetical protein
MSRNSVKKLHRRNYNQKVGVYCCQSMILCDREKGVLWNADFWYSRAGRVRPEMPIEEEWRRLVEEVLG